MTEKPRVPIRKRQRATIKRLHERPITTDGPATVDAEHRDGRLIVRITPLCPPHGQSGSAQAQTDLTTAPPKD